MTNDTLTIYSDASFSNVHGIAILGFIISTDEIDSRPQGELLNLPQPGSHRIFSKSIQEVNNIRAEIKSAICALKSAPLGKKIILYCDCQGVVNLPQRREKLEARNFFSQKKSKLIANAELYKEFYSTYDRVNPEIIWIKGHSPSSTLNPTQIIFSTLDKTLRGILRNKLSMSEDP